jgi:hypothetical protein
MKLKYIAVAIAAAAAGQAFAATTAPVTVGSIPAANFIYYTGASAPTNIVYNSLSTLCDAGTLSVYTKADISANVKPGDSAIGGSLGYTCHVRADAGTSVDGQDIAFLFQNSGGSINSVYGMNNATKKKFISLTAGCVNSGFVTSDANAYTINEKCTENVSRVSDGGFSDVEKQLWIDAFSAVPVTDFAIADVVVTPVAAGQPFSVAVSRPLYKAMQDAQGITGTGSPACDENNQEARCQPSITKRQYASIAKNDPFSSTKTDWSFLVGAAGAGKAVNLCRRPPTSGTQASSNAFFLDNPCAGFADQQGKLLDARFTDSVPGSFVVHEMSGTGDVKECLSGADLTVPADGVIGKGENFDLGLSPNANTTTTDWSIGVVSAENTPKTTSATETWRSVKLDGVESVDGVRNVASTTSGKYDFAYELALHTVPTVTSANAESVFQAMAVSMGDVSLPAITGLYRLSESVGTRGGNSCAPFSF